jgi:hypothetical protein
MKRTILATAILLGSVLGAHADRDIWSSTDGHPRGDVVLNGDISACAMTLGAPQNGVPTSREFKRCMLSHGWRFRYTVRAAPTRRGDLYPDPDDPGMMCRSYTAGGISQTDCSNAW